MRVTICRSSLVASLQAWKGFPGYRVAGWWHCRLGCYRLTPPTPPRSTAASTAGCTPPQSPSIKPQSLQQLRRRDLADTFEPVGDVHTDLVHQPRPAMYLPPYQD